MIVLGIETSCDETALALLECQGDLTTPTFKVVAEELFSQIEIHKKYGGVFPMMAKREHGRNLIPLLKNLLQKAGYAQPYSSTKNHSSILENTGMILLREPELLKDFLEYIPTIEPPTRPVRSREGLQRGFASNGIDMIAVTTGPGLEPALWVGINFAKALSSVWNIPVMPSNHMEGHLFSVLLDTTEKIKRQKSKGKIEFPIIALLVSGGHTDLILVKEWLVYESLGTTRDDAVGEAFDKVARILGLPYPGGPEISRLAKQAREKNLPNVFDLPRPMLRSGDFDFSFSGLKTSVLYKVQKMGVLSDDQKAAIAREFENAAIEVLVEKTRRAITQYGARTLVAAGGVIANTELRKKLKELTESIPEVNLLIPELRLSTDNAVMIAAAAYIRFMAGAKPKTPDEILETVAEGRMELI
ncbi:MAG TPA: tRNA (adenosine(37)-N6)-threonylcarbamoyltransferase complex transferase subunit TsaD [Candidatus Paceibacterota bacterium]